MNLSDRQAFIRQKAFQNRNDPAGAKVYWSRHAIVEMVRDELTRTQVEAALEYCEVIENYPVAHRPLPDCLVLAKLAKDQPLHAVVAIDEPNDRIFVVTVYRPSPDRWENDWKSRK